uniref:Uncharacterized protein n=1 Tax=viral metagenome TaxID=1070528 RepID=A0A6H2A3D8_9ZZZZ
MKIYGVKADGGFKVSPEQERLERHYLSGIKDGKLMTKEYKLFRQSKTWKQVKIIWGLALTTIEQHFKDNAWDTSYLLRIDKPTGNPCSKEQIYDYLLEVCPVYEDGKRIGLSKMSIEQAGQWYNAVSNFAASEWYVNIPDPDPDWFKKKEKKNAAKS